MFCGNCGSQVNDGSEFCPNCGARMEQTAGAAVPANAAAPFNQGGVNMTPPVQPASQKGNTMVLVKKYAPIGIGAVALIVIIAILVGIFGGGYKKPLKNYYKAIEKQDVQLMRENISELLEAEMSESEKESINKYIDEEIEELRDEYGMSSKSKISFKILDSKKLDKDEVKKLNDNIREYLKESTDSSYDYSKYEVTAAYQITVKETVKTGSSTEDFRKDYGLLKENGKWKIFPTNISNLYKEKDSD